MDIKLHIILSVLIINTTSYARSGFKLGANTTYLTHSEVSDYNSHIAFHFGYISSIPLSKKTILTLEPSIIKRSSDVNYKGEWEQILPSEKQNAFFLSLPISFNYNLGERYSIGGGYSFDYNIFGRLYTNSIYHNVFINSAIHYSKISFSLRYLYGLNRDNDYRGVSTVGENTIFTFTDELTQLPQLSGFELSFIYWF